MYKYAGIIINNEASEVDKIFTYKIPEDLTDLIKLGQRVKIPFGLGNKVLDGFVLELYESFESKYKLKNIIELCDDFTVLREEDIELIKRMKERYICNYVDCIKLIIPTGIISGIKQKTNYVVSIKNELDGKHNKKPYTEIYNFIIKNNGIYTKSELSRSFQFSLSSINTLIKNDILQLEEKFINRYDTRNFEQYAEKRLNDKQLEAVYKIMNSSEKHFLIHGVTGSGKTEIYMKLVSLMLKEDKEAIILVPEIALTPQMVERFKGRFGKDIAVFHSRLSKGERYDEWLRVKNKEVKVAVGARSAIFLPFSNLGLIVIDEEHENSYKSDVSPKYNAVEIGKMKSEIENCKLVLGSATPSIETYYRCLKKEYSLITIKERADGAKLPEIKIVDMRQELLNNNKSMFSRSLLESINSCLNKKEQVILFLNRRGHSTFVSCRKCGYVFKCDNCDISLTYHSESKRLVCHYCGKTYNYTSVCPKCKSKYVKYFGVGTEKIEQEVNRIFPSAKTLRMDHDTTRTKDSYEKIYNIFKNNDADILIGTQMIAKGLDFKNVTLVGIIAADLSLNLPDYRSNEKTFQLINQVSGRAGRGAKEGLVILQTYNTENYAIKAAADNDYLGFYNQEIELRKLMNYPPYSDILLINFSSKNEEQLIKYTQNIGILLKKVCNNYSKIDMLGPCPCVISKIKEMYRWQVIFKGSINSEIAVGIKKTIHDYKNSVYNEIRVSMDINPSSLL